MTGADESPEPAPQGADRPAFEAARYPDGSITYPSHPVGPGGDAPVGTVDLAEYDAEVVTWTTSTATPPGVREPNHLAIVEFDVDGEPVRAIGQVADDDVEIGDTVEPTYCEELRDPDAGIREAESQSWDGYRFRPVE
ncbi:OB-fold domain-containing protein [Halorarum halobium]|uniref:OB-fold domain-containing protein n=1 Tax=Halorarum halobium TaxID=3075121 RepID=UPI0028AF74BD|nr:OB-fold domain-containing protein [Halobaculum sp. XH14]